jgi:hypothetical protein
MAVFAGLAEVSATVALPQLSAEVQCVFVWFVMAFPFGIVIPFFIVLWFRPKHLYGPGDYRQDPEHLGGAAPTKIAVKKAKQQKTPTKPDEDPDPWKS